MTRFKIKIPIYGPTFEVWLSSPEEANERFPSHRAFKDLGHQNFKEFDGLCCFGGNPTLIWVNNAKGSRSDIIGRISHEVLHAIVRMMENKGAHLDNANHEPYTYLMEYVMKRIIKEAKL